MEMDFEKLMARKSDEDLKKYISDSARYTPEALTAAVSELKKRGQELNNEELTKINSEIEQKKEKEIKEAWTPYFDRNVTKESIAPMFYSQKVVWVFSLLFGVITGSILLSINLNKYNKKAAAVLTFLFGLAYSGLTIFVINYMQSNGKSVSGKIYLFNFLGAAVLEYLFWRKYIGKTTQYRTKPFGIPLIICIAISVLVIWASIYSAS